jgi:hypothetical protein
LILYPGLKVLWLHTIRARHGVHLGIHPYTDNRHTDEFAAPIATEIPTTSSGSCEGPIAKAFSPANSAGPTPRGRRPPAGIPLASLIDD